MPRIVAIAAAVGAILYCCVCAAVFFCQRSLIYFPPPAALTGHASRMVLNTEAGDVFVVTRPGDGSQALIYFGGNAEDVTLSMPDLQKAFPNHSLYLLQYRGYGGSAGKPTEDSLFSDASALLREVRRLHRQITIMGRSLGSGLAVRLASQNEIERLILVTPFYSLSDVAAAHYPWLPVRMLLRDRYESWRYAPEVTAPTLILAAGQDEVVPRESTARLSGCFRRAQVRYEVVRGAGHNTISGSAEYADRLVEPSKRDAVEAP